MDPIWSELETETPNIEFVKVESASVPAELGISGFPKFMKIENGKKTKTADGEMGKEDLKTALLSVGGRRRRPSRLTRIRRKRTVRRSTRRNIPLRTKLSASR